MNNLFVVAGKCIGFRRELHFAENCSAARLASAWGTGVEWLLSPTMSAVRRRAPRRREPPRSGWRPSRARRAGRHLTVRRGDAAAERDVARAAAASRHRTTLLDRQSVTYHSVVTRGTSPRHTAKLALTSQMSTGGGDRLPNHDRSHGNPRDAGRVLGGGGPQPTTWQTRSDLRLTGRGLGRHLDGGCRWSAMPTPATGPKVTQFAAMIDQLTARHATLADQTGHQASAEMRWCSTPARTRSRTSRT